MIYFCVTIVATMRTSLTLQLDKTLSGESQSSYSSSKYSPFSSPQLSPVIPRSKTTSIIDDNSSSSGKISSPKVENLQRVATSNSREFKELKDPLYEFTHKINTLLLARDDSEGSFIFFYRVYRLIYEKRGENTVKLKKAFTAPFTKVEENGLCIGIIRGSNSALHISTATRKNSCCIEVCVCTKLYSREYIEEKIIPKFIRYYDKEDNERFLFLQSIPIPK